MSSWTCNWRRYPSEAAWRYAATHEAGHCAAALALDFPIIGAEIYRDPAAVSFVGGRVVFPPREYHTKHACLARAIISLAGPAATHRYIGGHAGHIDQLGGAIDAEHAERYLARHNLALDEAVQQTSALITAGWGLVENLAAALVQRRCLTQAEVLAISRRV